ncbi:MAG: hypothetical protein LBG65_01795 [Puniceicoccales bacterium]|nr:hypothetical protein [Puniceicoccales bacterium]
MGSTINRARQHIEEQGGEVLDVAVLGTGRSNAVRAGDAFDVSPQKLIELEERFGREWARSQNFTQDFYNGDHTRLSTHEWEAITSDLKRSDTRRDRGTEGRRAAGLRDISQTLGRAESPLEGRSPSPDEGDDGLIRFSRPDNRPVAKTGALALWFRKNFLDDAAALKDFVKRYEQATGSAADDSPFDYLGARRLTADSIVKRMAFSGMVDPAGNETGAAALSDAWKGLDKEQRQTFDQYLEISAILGDYACGIRRSEVLRKGEATRDEQDGPTLPPRPEYPGAEFVQATGPDGQPLTHVTRQALDKEGNPVNGPDGAPIYEQVPIATEEERAKRWKRYAEEMQAWREKAKPIEDAWRKANPESTAPARTLPPVPPKPSQVTQAQWDEWQARRPQKSFEEKKKQWEAEKPKNPTKDQWDAWRNAHRLGIHNIPKPHKPTKEEWDKWFSEKPAPPSQVDIETWAATSPANARDAQFEEWRAAIRENEKERQRYEIQRKEALKEVAEKAQAIQRNEKIPKAERDRLETEAWAAAKRAHNFTHEELTLARFRQITRDGTVADDFLRRAKIVAAWQKGLLDYARSSPQLQGFAQAIAGQRPIPLGEEMTLQTGKAPGKDEEITVAAIVPMWKWEFAAETEAAEHREIKEQLRGRNVTSRVGCCAGVFLRDSRHVGVHTAQSITIAQAKQAHKNIRWVIQ